MQNIVSPTEVIRVLIIDDDEDDFFITSENIKDIKTSSFQIDWCSTYNKAVEAILNSTHNIYFVDYRLGIKTGIDLLKEAHANQIEEPIILLTGKGNQTIDMEAMRLGAADYLIKSELNSEKLERCIRYALEQSTILKRLRGSERKYRNIFEKTNDVIFVADENFILKDINQAIENLTGYTKEELLGTNLNNLFSKNNEREILSTSLQDNNKVDDFKIEMLTRHLEKRTCVISASLETDLRQEKYIQGIIHDITLLKKAEEVTLQSEKLEAKGRVIRTLAHEIRNPLNNINLSLDHLKSENVVSEYLEIIERNSKRINDLIGEMMDSNHYYKMKLVVAPLQSVVDEAIESAMDRIILNNIKIEMNYAPQPALALVDKEKLKMAFLNVILNAVEAMSTTGSLLRIEVNSKTDFHEVHIIDNGSGISSENIPKLFEPYFTSKPSGLGLGLATTHAIIQSHKGSIHVTSALQSGTTFKIVFPSL